MVEERRSGRGVEAGERWWVGGGVEAEGNEGLEVLACVGHGGVVGEVGWYGGNREGCGRGVLW